MQGPRTPDTEPAAIIENRLLEEMPRRRCHQNRQGQGRPKRLHWRDIEDPDTGEDGKEVPQVDAVTHFAEVANRAQGPHLRK